MTKEELMKLGLDEAMAIKVAAKSEEELTGYVPKKDADTAKTAAATAKAAQEKILATLGIQAGQDVDAVLAGLTATLEALKQTGTKPDEIGTKLAALTGQITMITEKLNASEKKAADERSKRIESAKYNKALAVLQKNNASSPEDLVELLVSKHIAVKDDDSMFFRNGDKEISIEDGIAGWLKSRPDFVINKAKAGAETTPPGDKPTEKMTYSEMCAYAEANPGAKI